MITIELFWALTYLFSLLPDHGYSVTSCLMFLYPCLYHHAVRFQKPFIPKLIFFFSDIFVTARTVTCTKGKHFLSHAYNDTDFKRVN